MKTFKQKLSIEAIHRIIGGELKMHTPAEICGVADPREANASSLIFFENEKYLPLVENTSAGLVVTKAEFTPVFSGKAVNLIITENPYQSVLILLHYWLEMAKGEFIPYIHPTAVIGENVIFDGKVNIGAYVVIEDGAVIGDHVNIKAHCHIGANVRIGDHSFLYPRVSIYEDCQLGKQVIIHSGSVIGADGFGYILMNGIQQKIPQVGNVVIHDYVEIGANTAIDRGTMGSTVIGEGTKIDNLVQVGHNCIIGKHSILCAQVGLAGSTIIGDYVYLAGQVGAAGHITIGDKAMVGAQSGISGDLAAEGKYFGTPARDAQRMKRIMAVENSLPDIYKFINQLKRDKERE